MDFQLYLPKAWAEAEERRREAHLPEAVTFKAKWELGLEMVDRARAWGLPVEVVVADAGYGVVTEFRTALRERELRYVMGVFKEVGVWRQPVEPIHPAYQGRGRPRTWPRDLPRPEAASRVALNLPETAWCEVVWRQGAKGPLRSRFAAIRARPSHGHVRGKLTEPMRWLIIEWPPEADQPTKFWLSNLPEETSLRDLVYWAKIRWWVEQNYQQLKDDIGLDHFEGRSWVGWHHHVTLSMIAFDFLVLEGFRLRNNFWVDPPTCQTGTSACADEPAWLLPTVPPEGGAG